MSDDSYVTVGNTTDGPLVIDEAGRTIEAHGFGTVNADRSPARRLLADGYLVEVPAPGKNVADEDVNPDALRAFRATARRNGGDTATEALDAETELEAKADTDAEDGAGETTPADPPPEGPTPRTARRRPTSSQEG